MDRIKTFKEYKETDLLNEGKVTLGKMKFTVSTIIDGKGLAVTFIPDSKTLDFSKNEQVNEISEQLKKVMPEMADMFWFESGNHSAGCVFRLDQYKLAEIITKQINKNN